MNKKHKHNLLPVEYSEDDSSVAYDEQIINDVIFLEDFYHIKKGDHYHTIYISFGEDFISLRKFDDDGDDDEVFYVQFKIVQKN
jgi:hypothetical protein